MTKKKLAYFLVCSDNIIFAAGNVALSLNRYMPNKEFEIVIYHTGLREANESALLSIPRVKLHKFEWGDSFDKKIMPHLPEGRWNNPNSLLAFAHYEIFNLLNIYQTVIWLDVDIAIQGDISSLESYTPFGLALDKNWNCIWRVRDQFLDDFKTDDYDLERSSYINACIVVNDKLKDWNKLRDYCYKSSLKYAEYLKNCDQAIFSLMLQDFSIKPKVIPWEEYICHAQHADAAIAKIVHFGTEVKIWNNEKYIKAFPEWFRTHLEWLKLGGEDFDRSKICLRSIYSDLFGEKNDIDISIEVEEGDKDFLRVRDDQEITKHRTLILNFIPIFVTKRNKHSSEVKVIGVPIYKKIDDNNVKSIRLFGFVDLIKVKRNNRNKRVFYLFGLPLFSIQEYSYRI